MELSSVDDISTADDSTPSNNYVGGRKKRSLQQMMGNSTPLDTPEASTLPFIVSSLNTKSDNGIYKKLLPQSSKSQIDVTDSTNTTTNNTSEILHTFVPPIDIEMQQEFGNFNPSMIPTLLQTNSIGELIQRYTYMYTLLSNKLCVSLQKQLKRHIQRKNSQEQQYKKKQLAIQKLKNIQNSFMCSAVTKQLAMHFEQASTVE